MYVDFKIRSEFIPQKLYTSFGVGGICSDALKDLRRMKLLLSRAMSCFSLELVLLLSLMLQNASSFIWYCWWAWYFKMSRLSIWYCCWTGWLPVNVSYKGNFTRSCCAVSRCVLLLHIWRVPCFMCRLFIKRVMLQ